MTASTLRNFDSDRGDVDRAPEFERLVGDGDRGGDGIVGGETVDEDESVHSVDEDGGASCEGAPSSTLLAHDAEAYGEPVASSELECIEGEGEGEGTMDSGGKTENI